MNGIVLLYREGTPIAVADFDPVEWGTALDTARKLALLHGQTYCVEHRAHVTQERTLRTLVTFHPERSPLDGSVSIHTGAFQTEEGVYDGDA